MAERLTKKITKTIQDKYSLGSYLYYDFNGVENTNRLLNKLGKLEDIMERLGINFVEDLEDEIKSLRVDKYVYKKDRDTWQKACELASEREDDCYVYDNIHRAYEFYHLQKCLSLSQSLKICMILLLRQVQRFLYSLEMTQTAVG